MAKGYAHHARENKARAEVGKRLDTIMDKIYSLTDKKWGDLEHADLTDLENIFNMLETMAAKYR